MTIVDTSVWIDYLDGRANIHTEWLDQRIGTLQVGLTDLILCEVLQGIRDEVVFHRTQKELLQFELLSSGGEALAVKSAVNYRTLRSRGHTVRKTIDCLIATVCMERRHSLLHRDRDFDAFEQYLGLQGVHPKAV